MQTIDYEIQEYRFSKDLFEDFNDNHYVKDLWPVVYILSDHSIKESYVGETADAYSRMETHLKNSKKNRLTSVRLITSEKFNKSAALDIESNLIKYLSADGQFKLLNANVGLANHNYYQKKEVYWDMFNSIWDSLRSDGIAKHSIKHIDNSDLFKYSPYKSLTKEQQQGLLVILKALTNKDHKSIIIEGGAGTGKTILAIYLFKILNLGNDDFSFKEFGDEESEFLNLILSFKQQFPNPNMALVVPMTSLRTTLKKVFKNIKGLSAKMVIGPAEVARNKYDIIIVDESHRLRRRVNLGAYYGVFDKACVALGLNKMSCSELDWVTMQSKKLILFYDEDQSIKPSDAKKEDFDNLKKSKFTKIEKLKSQFRVRGGNAYVEFIDKLLNSKLDKDQEKFNSREYECILFDSIEEMVDQIKLRESEHGLSRLIAGYSWEWISNKDESLYDIEIAGLKLRWNTTNTDWINSEKAINEVGCIHTTQGYDLNYSGIIFGHEISYDKNTDKIVIREENYYDKNGKQSIKNPKELRDFIINIYKTIMLRGIKGTYIYVCDEALREYLSQYIPKRREKKELVFSDHKIKNSLPIYDLTVDSDSFGDVVSKWVVAPNEYATNDYFAAMFIGESMNKIIPNGSICLFKKDEKRRIDGEIILAQADSIIDQDFGSCYTIKELEKKTNESNEVSLLLKSISKDNNINEISFNDEKENTLKIIGVFVNVL